MHNKAMLDNNICSIGYVYRQFFMSLTVLFLLTILYCFERMSCMEWPCLVPVCSRLWFNMQHARNRCVCVRDIIFCTVYFWPDLSSCSRACLLHTTIRLNNLGRRLNSLLSKYICSLVMNIINSSCLLWLSFLFTIHDCFERMSCMEWPCLVPVCS